MNAVSRGGWSRHHQIIAAKYACSARSASTQKAAANAITRVGVHVRFKTSFARELVPRRERPGARDAQDVGVAADVVRKRRVRTGHLDDLHRRRIENPMPRLAGELALVA